MMFSKRQIPDGETPDLLPCPFCGGAAFKWHTNYATYIECRSTTSWHRVQISARTEAQAMIDWNKRSADAFEEGYTAGEKNAYRFALDILEAEKKAVKDGAYGSEAALGFACIMLKAMKGDEQE